MPQWTNEHHVSRYGVRNVVAEYKISNYKLSGA